MIRATARLRSKETPENPMAPLSPIPQDPKIHNKNNIMGRTPENDSSPNPMEISDDEPWTNMAVRSSEESAFTSKRSLAMIATALGIFLLVMFDVLQHDSSRSHIKNYKSNKGSSNNASGNDNELVPPVTGEVALASAEFRDVRTARPKESVLITGGLGFIGSHVVELLLHRGFKVTILDDESNGHNHNRFAKELVPHDITILDDYPKLPAVDGKTKTDGDEEAEDVHFTHVIHLAAAISVAESMNDPGKYERINYEGSQKVLDWILEYNTRQLANDTPRTIKKMVAASSAAIYGDPDPSLLPLKESTAYGGKSPYADTKYRMEGLMRKFVEVQKDWPSHTNGVALRFFNVYGPRQDPKNPYSGVISLFLEAAMTGKDITVLGDGEMTRDFVYVKDVARAIVLALLQEDKGLDFSVYNVCTGKSITINTLAEQVKQSMDSNSETKHLDPRDGDIRESSCNPDGAKGGIGFSSAVSQQTGLKKTSDWFKLEEESNPKRRRLEEDGDQGYYLQ